MKCIIVNLTATMIGRAWELVSKVEKPDGTSSTSNTPALEPNVPTEVGFHNDEAEAGVKCIIELQIDTIVIKNNNGKSIEVTEDGMTIEIIDNPANPALAKDDFEKIHRHVVQYAEGRQPSINVAPLFDRPEADEPLIWRQFENYMCSHAFKKPRWMDFMVPPIFADIPATPDSIKAALQDASSNTIVVYFRALERSPGGNADTFVYKFTVNREKGTVSCASFRNWDGSAMRTEAEEEVTHENAVASIISAAGELLVPAMLKLVDSGANILGSIRNYEGTIDEPAEDSDEYDTQWSSIEVLLFKGSAPEGAVAEASLPLLLRVHQRSVYVNRRQGWAAPPLVEPRNPAAQELLDVIAAVTEGFGMGTPEQTSEGETPASNLFSDLSTADVDSKASYVMPIYLLK